MTTSLHRLFLASGSPRRRDLLASIGLDFEVVVSQIDEVHRDGESPENYVARLATEKANAVVLTRPEAWVIGADTTVVIGGELLEKPSDRADGERMLRTISGKSHTVHTGIALLGPNWRQTEVVSTRVAISPMSAEEIAWYVATGEPMDKAGAYAAQGIGAMFIESIEGSYTNVVGLPLATLMQMMKRAGWHLVRGAWCIGAAKE